MTPLLFCLLLSAKPMVQVGQAPAIILFTAAETGEGRTTERRLYEELSLLLADFMVMSSPIGVDGFQKLSLSEQMANTLPVARDNGAVAAVWMAEPLPGQLMLHLVALGSGRGMVRTLEFDSKSRSARAERGLALVIRELLGTAFLLEPPREVPAPLTEVVREVRRQMPGAPTSKSP